MWVRDTSVTPACYDSAFVYELIEVDYGPPAEIEIFPIDCQTANVVATFPTTGQYEVFLRLDGNVILETFVEGDQVEFLQLEINEYDIFAVNLATGCESETPFSIPALNELEITSVIVENTSCFGECDGAIFIEVAGGVAPLFYQWANGETSQNIDNLCAGWYGLTVVDGNGCTGESNFLVEEPSLIVAEVVEFVPPSCGQSNGFLQLVASGGTPPYIYSLDGIDSESGIFSGLPVGDYSFTVTDANGCFVMPSFTLEDTGINAFIIGDGALNCIDNTAELLAFPEGDFQYEWTGPNGFTATTRDIFIGDAGLYTVMITDLNDPSCTGIAEFFVEDAPAISLQTIVDYDECQIPLVSGTVAPAGSYGVQIL
ncbi:MAG: SprB repeat-containing protein, partial [Bacteroidota bacterium]